MKNDPKNRIVYIAELGDVHAYHVVGVSRTSLRLEPASDPPFARPSGGRIVDKSIPMTRGDARSHLSQLLRRRMTTDLDRLGQLI